MFTESRLLRLVADVYEAAADPVSLVRLAQTLAHAFDAGSALVVLDEMPNGRALPPTLAVPSTTQNFDTRAQQAYAEYYHDINIWLQEGLKNPLPAVVLCNEIVDEATLLRHEWYDYCRETGMFHCLGTAFAIGDNVMGEIGIHRRRNEAPLVADDKSKMEQLRPHLQRALQIHHRLGMLEGGRMLGLSVLQNLAIGVIVVDAKARVLFANEIAERALGAKAGITVAGGLLSTTEPRCLGDLRRLISDSARTSAGSATIAGGVVAAGRQNGAALLLTVAPLRSQTLGFGPPLPAALITFRDPNDDVAIDDRALVQAFGLTLAEARMASALASGMTLREYADREGITIATARTHLKHVFEKTGWRRQAQLARALAGPLLRAQ